MRAQCSPKHMLRLRKKGVCQPHKEKEETQKVSKITTAFVTINEPN